MFKKLLVATAIMTTCASTVFADAAPYLGGSLGINNISASNRSSYRGAPVSVFAGYGATINQDFYLGGELFGTLGTITINTASPSLRTTYGYGASILPGYMLSANTLTFVRAGLVRSQFSAVDSNVTGGQLGLGMQTRVTQNWDLRGEYDYTKYNSVRGASPRSDMFNLGMVYKIN